MNLFKIFSRYYTLLALISIAFSGTSSAACIDEDGRCTLGIFPHTSLRQVESTYSTIVEELSLTLDREFRLSTSSSTDKFENGLRNNKYDIALVGVGFFLDNSDNSAYVPLARREQDLIYQVISLPNKPFRTLNDIKGKRFGTLPHGNGSRHAMKLIMHSNKINIEKDFITSTYISQQACIHALLANLIDACGAANIVKDIFQHEMKVEFQVLASSPPLPNIAYIANKAIGESLVKEAREYFLDREGYIPAKKSDYASYRIPVLMR